MKRAIAVLALLALVALAGCNTGLDPQEAVNGSEAVSSMSIVEEDNVYLEITLSENVRKNNEVCTTKYDPALGTTRTECHDNWHPASIDHVVIERNETQWDSMEVSNGDTIRTEVTWPAGTYRFYFQSEKGEDTWFQVSIERDEIVSAGYTNDY